jgi:hypothetical protein
MGYLFYEGNEFLVQINKELKIEKKNYHIYRSINNK